MTRQSPSRSTIRIGRANGQQNVFSDDDACELIGIENGACIPMVMAKQEVGLASEHDLLTRLHRVGDEIKGTQTLKQRMVSDPMREKCERQRMCGGYGKDRCFAIGNLERRLSQLVRLSR